MGRAAAGKMKPAHSWTMAIGLYYPSSSSSSGKSRRGQPAEAMAKEEVKEVNGNNGDDGKKSGGGKRSISISRSIACTGSICSTKDSAVMSRGSGDGSARSASSRSLKAPGADVARSASSRSLKAPGPGADAARSASSRSLKVPDDVAAAAAAISATSSFNSETTATTVTASSSPVSSSALSSPVSSFSFGTGSFRGVPQITKLSGCYTECHAVFDPTSRSLAAAALPCADCDEVFAKADSLELHRATRHAVSELRPEDTSRNVVEIIFQSSWPSKKQQQPSGTPPMCRIERVLKVQSSGRTVKRFEQYRESIRERANGDQGKKNARCVADGNELLRFYATTFTCALGAAGGTALCRAPATRCTLCGIIRDGFRVDGEGKIATMATSGRAHDTAEASLSDGEKRAMLVCRVVAGRVKRAITQTTSMDDSDCDSVSPCSEGVYSDLDELYVFNPRAILPCFVVIYSGY